MTKSRQCAERIRLRTSATLKKDADPPVNNFARQSACRGIVAQDPRAPARRYEIGQVPAFNMHGSSLVDFLVVKANVVA